MDSHVPSSRTRRSNSIGEALFKPCKAFLLTLALLFKSSKDQTKGAHIQIQATSSLP